jgi:hypothetical protein
MIHGRVSRAKHHNCSIQFMNCISAMDGSVTVILIGKGFFKHCTSAQYCTVQQGTVQVLYCMYCTCTVLYWAVLYVLCKIDRHDQDTTCMNHDHARSEQARPGTVRPGRARDLHCTAMHCYTARSAKHNAATAALYCTVLCCTVLCL